MGGVKKRHEAYSLQVLLRPQGRDVTVDSESYKERCIPFLKKMYLFVIFNFGCTWSLLLHAGFL